MLTLKNVYRNFVCLFLLICAPTVVYSSIEEIKNIEVEQELNTTEIIKQHKRHGCKKHKELSYYLYVSDFIGSFIEIPTSNVLLGGSTLSSKYLAGRAPIYNIRNERAGTCSASFLCMQNAENIFTDIANYLVVDNGLIVTWFTPTTLLNLELDSIVNSMVTECIVTATTKVGFNPFYGKKFNMVVSSDSGKIFFNLTQI